MKKFTIFLENAEDMSVEQILTNAWADKSSGESEYEFYHKMRLEKMDHKILEDFVRKMVAQQAAPQTITQ